MKLYQKFSVYLKSGILCFSKGIVSNCIFTGNFVTIETKNKIIGGYLIGTENEKTITYESPIIEQLFYIGGVDFKGKIYVSEYNTKKTYKIKIKNIRNIFI